MTVFGFDVNSYKSTVDASLALSHGFEFFMAKASEGQSYRDPSYGRFAAAAKPSGALFAAYHFLHGDSPVSSQAKNALAAVGDPSIPLMIDCERTGSSPEPNMKVVNDFRAAYKSLGGTVSNLLYLPGWWWSTIGRPSVAGWDLWQSAYGSNGGTYPGDTAPGWRYPNGGVVAVLQYTSRGRLPGYSGDIDMSAFKGTRDELAATGWFIDYKEPDVTPQDIQNAVANTPIVVAGGGTTEPLQQVLRQILNAPKPTVPNAKDIAAAVVAALPTPPTADAIAQAVLKAYGPPYVTASQIEDAVATVLKNGVDSAPPSA